MPGFATECKTGRRAYVLQGAACPAPRQWMLR